MTQTSLIRISIIITLLLFNSCSKSIYSNQHGSSSSKFVLYKNTFKYEENTIHSGFTAKGNYEINDNHIHFKFDKKLFHNLYIFTSSLDGLRKVEKMDDDDNIMKINVLASGPYEGEPLLGATVYLRNKSGEVIKCLTTDFDGNAEFEINDSIESVEIICLAYNNIFFKIADYINWDLNITMVESYQSTINTRCIQRAEGYTENLFFEIDNRNDIKTFSYLGFTYVKK